MKEMQTIVLEPLLLAAFSFVVLSLIALLGLYHFSQASIVGSTLGVGAGLLLINAVSYLKTRS